MIATKTCLAQETLPDQQKITRTQAKRIAALANIKFDEKFTSLTIAQMGEQLKWRIDPALFLFRKICGRVVKKDLITGVEYPVPYATVYVEDTDCNLISYFPKLWHWGWYFPFFCHREVIGTTKTDACGNFCVWVPRFDIDWVLEWRKKRVCLPIALKRPSIGDLIDKLKKSIIAVPWPPAPDPDPGPLATLTNLPVSTVEAIAGPAARQLAQRVARLQATQTFGAPNQLTENLLNARAFEMELPPPLPTEFHQVLAEQGIIANKEVSIIEGIRSTIAMKLGLDPAGKEIADFNPQRFIGPFLRCYDIIVPEWQVIYDVPDITFRVTQDTNGDGVEEAIYSESYFDVRWDTSSPIDVMLVASSIAKETHVCKTPDVPCSDIPAILFAGLMPLTNPTYFDTANGYALRPNRPSNNGAVPVWNDFSRSLAQTPFCWTLQLYGCVNVKGAKFYRVLQSTDGGTTFSAVTGLSWNLYKVPDGHPVTITSDANGWYEVLTNPTDYHPEKMVLEWPTPPIGKSVLKIEIGNASKNHIDWSTPVAIQTDNTHPTVSFTQLAWKFVGEPDNAFRSLLGIPCPTIHRGKIPQDIEVVFEVSVSAYHLRNAYIATSGCGGSSFVLVPNDSKNNPDHWHKNVFDNAVVLHQRYSLDHSALEGAYSFSCVANNRAMNPSGADGGHSLPYNWYYDPIYIYTHPYIGVAIVNEN
jgi:hypothetical protein